MNKRTVTWILATALAAGALATAGTVTAYAEETKTIKFFHRFPDEPFNSYIERKIAEYEEMHPEIDFVVESAQNALERIRNSVDNLKYLQDNASVKELKEEEQAVLEEAKAYVDRFDEAMDDDLNTADAISVIFELVRFANSNLSAENSAQLIKEVRDEIITLSDILGLIVEKKEEVLDEDIEKLIADRQAARKAKDFAKADAIRAQLFDMGIELLDTREGVKWKRV